MQLFVISALLTISPPCLAQSCPDVDPSAGYPVVARALAGAAVTPEWLQEVARSVAYRWRVPSRRRNAYAGWDRVRRRLLPPEPRWADDWQPTAGQEASITLVFLPDGSVTGLVSEPSGDPTFDESLVSIWENPMPASPSFPHTDMADGDTIVAVVDLGTEPHGEAHGMIRFAAQQTPIELNRSSLRIRFSQQSSAPPPRVTVKYDVSPTGRVVPNSIEFLGSVSVEFERAIREGLLAAHFGAPTSNCRSIGQTVVQVIG